VIKHGAVLLQQKSQLPIVPVGIAAAWKYTFTHSWDKMELPLPGSRIVIYYGEPIHNLKGMQRNDAARLINQALVDANNAAQKQFHFQI
jgi:hypothetical protein